MNISEDIAIKSNIIKIYIHSNKYFRFKKKDMILLDFLKTLNIVSIIQITRKIELMKLIYMNLFYNASQIWHLPYFWHLHCQCCHGCLANGMLFQSCSVLFRDPIQDALPWLQVQGYLPRSAYRCLQLDHVCETRAYSLPLSVYVGDWLGFETVKVTIGGRRWIRWTLTSVLHWKTLIMKMILRCSPIDARKMQAKTNALATTAFEDEWQNQWIHHGEWGSCRWGWSLYLSGI